MSDASGNTFVSRRKLLSALGAGSLGTAAAISAGNQGLVKKSWTVDANGFASLPEGPGLGVEIDEKVLEEYAKNPKQKWEWPTRGRLEDGSISDY